MVRGETSARLSGSSFDFKIAPQAIITNIERYNFGLGSEDEILMSGVNVSIGDFYPMDGEFDPLGWIEIHAWLNQWLGASIQYEAGQFEEVNILTSNALDVFSTQFLIILSSLNHMANKSIMAGTEEGNYLFHFITVCNSTDLIYEILTNQMTSSSDYLIYKESLPRLTSGLKSLIESSMSGDGYQPRVAERIGSILHNWLFFIANGWLLLEKDEQGILQHRLEQVSENMILILKELGYLTDEDIAVIQSSNKGNLFGWINKAHTRSVTLSSRETVRF